MKKRVHLCCTWYFLCTWLLLLICWFFFPLDIIILFCLFGSFLFGVINSPERSTCGVGDLGGFMVGDLEQGFTLWIGVLDFLLVGVWLWIFLYCPIVWLLISGFLLDLVFGITDWSSYVAGVCIAKCGSAVDDWKQDLVCECAILCWVLCCDCKCLYHWYCIGFW